MGKSRPRVPRQDRDEARLARAGGPPLLHAVERVLGELRRLRATPGLRSDFDGLIAAYTRTREEIQRDVDQP
jgi:hypothetical protein